MTWSFVQGNGSSASAFTYAGNVVSATVTLTGVTAGNMLVLAVGANQDGTLSVSDGTGNTWSTSNRLTQTVTATTNVAELWWVPAAAGGSTTVTVTRTGGTQSFMALYLAEYDFTGGSVSLRTSVGASSPSGTSHTSGSTPSAATAGDLVLGAFFRATSNLSPAASDGKTARAGQASTTGMSPALSELLSASAGTQSVSFSTSTANSGAVIAAVFSDGGAAPVTSTQYAGSATTVSGTWTTPTNATGSTAATVAAFTSSTSGATAELDLSGFDFSAIPTGSTVNSVTVSVAQYVSNTARNLASQAQVMDGATTIGALQTLTLTTTTTNVDTFTVSPTLTQLKSSTFKVRFTGRKAANTQSSSANVDYVSVAVNYTAPAGTPLTAPFTESDALTATLVTSVALAPAFAETDTLAATLASPTILTPAFAEADTLAATLGTSTALTPAFAESDTLAASLVTSPGPPVLTVDPTETISPAFAESDALAVTLASATTLTVALAESDALSVALVSPTVLTAALAETDTLAAALVTSPAAPVLTVDPTETITAGFAESSTLTAILVTSVAIVAALQETDALAAAISGGVVTAVETRRGTATLTGAYGTATLTAAQAGTATLTSVYGTATLDATPTGTATLQE